MSQAAWPISGLRWAAAVISAVFASAVIVEPGLHQATQTLHRGG
jgi:hypothetical protein